MMGAVTADTDTEHLTSNADGDSSDRALAAAEVNHELQTNFFTAKSGSTSTTSTRRRFATIAASAALYFFLLMLSGGFCVWTVMKLSHIEARLERLERARRPTIEYTFGPPQSDDYFIKHLPVSTAVIFMLVSCGPVTV